MEWPVELGRLTLDDLNEPPGGCDLSLIVPETGEPGATYVLLRFGQRGDSTIVDRFGCEKIGERLRGYDREATSPWRKGERTIQMVRHGLLATDVLGHAIPDARLPMVLSLPRVPRMNAADRRVAALDRQLGFRRAAA